jgi:HD-GYP domain-containing protein (c-di-GMP phosphodiesterase class II)
MFTMGADADVEKMVAVHGNVPASVLNESFMMASPFILNYGKYADVIDILDDRLALQNFLRMEKWLFGGPDAVGQTFKEFIRDFLKGNKLVKGTLEVGGRKVDLKELTMPILNIYAEKDHIVPPPCTVALGKHGRQQGLHRVCHSHRAHRDLHSMTLRIDLKSAILALSDALDLVGVNDFQHGKRVAMIARETALMLGLPDKRLDRLVCASLLHDLGVSSTAVHRRLLHEADWDARHTHCETGYCLLQPFAHLSQVAMAIRYHHTPWVELPAGLDEADALDSNLILLGDRVDACLLQLGLENPLFNRHGIVDAVASLAGRELSPEVVEAFLAAATREAFWIALVPRHVQSYLADLPLKDWRITIDFPQFGHVARLISSIVDAKSHFTAAHSLGVAQLARYLGEHVGLPADALAEVEVAGLMHDVGKLCVPDEIVDKPAPLTPLEFSVMERHSFETYQILRHIPGLEQVAEWAAFHHEALNGHGYPFRRSAERLSPEARIIAVADIFQALAQERPYRGRQRVEQIPHFLNAFVNQGVLDGDLVALACADLDGCWRAATPEVLPASA